MKTTRHTVGKIVLGAMIMGVTLGGCATDYGYRDRYRDRHDEPRRCHDGDRDNNRGCHRYWNEYR